MIFYRIILWFKDIRNGVKWFFQRLLRGYSDNEVWDLFWYNAKWLLPRLRSLKEIRHGFPAVLLKNEMTFIKKIANGDEKADKKWGEVLDKMILAFELIVSDDWDLDEGKKKKVDEGMDLFRKYFFYLWD